MAEIIIDSYSETNQNSQSAYNGPGGVESSGGGQSFTVLKKSKLTACKFYQFIYGSPTGNCYAKLYAHSGTYGTDGKPTGSALATSDAKDVATLSAYPTMALATYTFSGANQIKLPAGKYCITFEYTGGDSDNQPYLGFDTSSPSHSGNLISRSDAGVWTANAGIDCCFYVYGELVPSGGLGIGNPYIF